MRASLLVVAGGLFAAAASAEAADASAATPGRVVYEARCAVCHGDHADGRSKLAEVMRPRPSSLRDSRLDAKAMTRIVAEGGQSVGRSPNMPAWSGELSGAEIAGVVGYLQGVTARP